MATYRIADIPAEYDCKYNTLKSRSQKYLTEAGAEKAQKIVVTEEYYASRKERFPTASDEQLEYMGTGTFFYKTLLRFDGMMLHASAVAADGEAYLFSAPSGTGKSTHTALWQEFLGKDKVLIINDDKPAIRKKDSVYLAYGTPFSGKYDISINAGFPIKGICFLERSNVNYIGRLDVKEAIAPLFDQTVRPVDEEGMELLCERADDLLRSVPFYRMGCNMSVDAAALSYRVMKYGKLDF